MVYTIVDGMTTMNSPFDILVIGKLGVGKTSLLRKYVMGTYAEPSFELSECLVYKTVEYPCYGLDRGVGSSDYTTNKQISILDSSAGVDSLLTHNSYQVNNAQTMVFTYSAACSESFEWLEYTINCIESVRDKLPPCVIVSLKSNQDELVQVLSSQGEELAKSCGALLFAEAYLYDDSLVDDVFAPLIELTLRREEQKRFSMKPPSLSKNNVQMSTDSVLITRPKNTGFTPEEYESPTEEHTQNESTNQSSSQTSRAESTFTETNDEQHINHSVHQDLTEKFSDFGTPTLNSMGSTGRCTRRSRSINSKTGKAKSGCCIIM